MQLLVVEDEPQMAELLRQGLTEDGHVVTAAHNGLDALALAASEHFDAIVLDLMLPGLDGLEVARRLRTAGCLTPILMLTARDRVADIVTGLDSGGDDYITKPFALDELLARVRAVARRGPIARPVVLSAGGLALDTGSRTATRAGRAVSLTRTEYLLLELLMRNAGRVVPRDTIVAGVWGYDNEVEPNTLEAFVYLLRTKVDHGHAHRLIHTVRGVGYMIREVPA
ncbi:MAG: response regulator transcription factor [Bryobacterales bacterium]|nr:response regulator transcription factor [Bryobacterales bacterium]